MMRNANKQESVTHKQKISKQKVPVRRYRCQLSRQRLQTSYYEYVQTAKGNRASSTKERYGATACQIEAINKETEIIKKNQKEILQWKSTMTKMKNSLEGLNSLFGLTEERMSEFEGPSIEIMLSEEHREKRTKKKMNRASEKCGHH